jgi:putative redox protein
MTVLARRLDGYSNQIEVDDGHTLLVDEPLDKDGTDTGPRPTRLLAASLAGCISITVEMYARRKGWDMEGLEVHVDMDYKGPVPSRFRVGMKLPSHLSPEQRERLLRIAARCPVHKVLAGEARVSVAERLER